SGEAIVLSSAVPVKSSPDNASKDIFIVHEGTKVFTGEKLNQWVEITLADGNKGWIIESAIEVI
ncbi:MAG: competence protein, partial [Alistipes sp.]|nr:competence protein [Alistipes sp.]